MGLARPNSVLSAPTRRPILFAIFALGVSCVMTQLALMREMVGAFAGNELVLGVVLGNWLLLMGLGAALGRWADRVKEPLSAFAALLIFTAILPPAQIVALRGLRQLVFLRGAAIGVSDTVTTSFLLLLPYCVAAGFMLTLACAILARMETGESSSWAAGRVYVADSLGSIAGGAVFSFVLIHWLDHVALLCVPAVLNLAVAGWIAFRIRRGGLRLDAKPASATHRGEAATAGLLLVVASALLVGLVALVLVTSPDAASTALQFPGQRILFRGNSPYGRFVVTETGGQINFLENGVAVATSPNIEAAEEAAHYAMAQRPGARRVLLVSGLLSGAAREILRYGVGELDCVELDPLVVAAGGRFLPQELTDRRLRLFATDARQFVRRTSAKYEVVIVALPDPSTAQLNRFFTAEFFAEVKRVLAPGGVLEFAVGRYENYASPELARLLSSARQTAARSFKNVVLIPGGRVYFLASDGPVQTNIAALLERQRLRARLVNRNYLATMLAPDRLAEVNRAAAQPAPVNRDFAPALYFLHLRHWASQFRTGFGWPQMLALVIFVVYLARLRGPALALFASGFAGTTLEIVLLFGLQVQLGSLYQHVGLVITLFMAGLAVGAWAVTRWGKSETSPKSEVGNSPIAREVTENAAAGRVRFSGLTQRGLPALALAIALLAAVLPLALRVLSPFTVYPSAGVVVPAVIGLLTFALAALAGAQFPLANRLQPDLSGRTVSRLYAADFVGACLGALLTSTLLLPLIGVTGACLGTAALNLAAALSQNRKGIVA